MGLPITTLDMAITAPFAATPVFADISADLLEATVTRGRQYYLDRIEASTLTLVLDNSSGNYWKDNTGGAYYPYVDVGKMIRLTAYYNPTNYILFLGFISQWIPAWRGTGKLLPVMIVRAADLLRNLSRFELPNAGYAQQRSDVRIGAVLDSLGWPAARRDLNTGQTTVQTTGTIANVKGLAHLQSVQDSELGIMFIAGDGDVQFHDRHARYKSPFLTSSATFGDDPGEMPYSSIEIVNDDAYVYNDVRMTRNGGTEQAATDGTSQTAYGQRTLSRQGLLHTGDTEVLAQAQALLSRYKNSSNRIKSITINPQSDEANLYPKVLGYDLSTRITVRLNQASLDEEFHIEGIEHDFRPGFWETKWYLTDADSQSYWILGTSQLGTTTRLGY